MAESPTDSTPAEQQINYSVDIRGGRTEIRVSGERDTSVIVHSESGEKIYLPPEDFERDPDPERTTYDSPYQSGSGAQDSPYETHPDASSVTGLEPTADGYLIIHPEPATDIRVLR